MSHDRSKWEGSHRRTAERLRPFAVGTPCARCGRLMLPGQALDLDHDDDRPGAYLGFSHATCNRRGSDQGQQSP